LTAPEGKGSLITELGSKVERKKLFVSVMLPLGHMSWHKPQKQHFPRSILGYSSEYLFLYSSGAAIISIARLGHILKQSPQEVQLLISNICSPRYPSGIGMLCPGNRTVIGLEKRFFSTSNTIPNFISITCLSLPDTRLDSSR